MADFPGLYDMPAYHTSLENPPQKMVSVSIAIVITFKRVYIKDRKSILGGEVEEVGPNLGILMSNLNNN